MITTCCVKFAFFAAITISDLQDFPKPDEKESDQNSLGWSGLLLRFFWLSLFCPCHLPSPKWPVHPHEKRACQKQALFRQCITVPDFSLFWGNWVNFFVAPANPMSGKFHPAKKVLSPPPIPPVRQDWLHVPHFSTTPSLPAARVPTELHCFSG